MAVGNAYDLSLLKSDDLLPRRPVSPNIAPLLSFFIQQMIDVATFLVPQCLSNRSDHYQQSRYVLVSAGFSTLAASSSFKNLHYSFALLSEFRQADAQLERAAEAGTLRTTSPGSYPVTPIHPVLCRAGGNNKT
ncbi:hypothetical protein HETIRDRAFT_105642 [Heterobasidion irregulare TC 32-1]|uniref:Uncharacterized protein n=1 Tax=Heterobasidion irregulare (strain TC 32-1) TaxID=747525 RepID=W4JWC1_HETIT|nr:uncharacterized protein HETIRDRAFT_105642 [Heterobasidion irregulare TC 32-1]ETW77186.1 hypothetical protein HETIRDRAFT_105642 [Heterobasidion irregulare TC 32-1]